MLIGNLYDSIDGPHFNCRICGEEFVSNFQRKSSYNKKSGYHPFFNNKKCVEHGKKHIVFLLFLMSNKLGTHTRNGPCKVNLQKNWIKKEHLG